MIWLVDYTSYYVDISSDLKAIKQEYFKIKGYKRKITIGQTSPVKTENFSNGLLRIATLLTQNGVECKYLHYTDLIACLDNGESLPEVIAFSTVCPTVPRAAELCKRIKEISPKTKVYIGGPQINNAPRLTREKFPCFDKLTVGYDTAAASLVADREIVCKGQFVDYSLLPHPLSYYAINTLSATGCPFACAYCADGRAPKQFVSDDCLVSQMKPLLEPRTLVHVFDSVFGYSRERAKDICKNLQRIGNPFLLSCDMRAEILDRELVEEMQKAGFVEIRMGIESADEDLLLRNNRTLGAQKCLDTVKMIKECSNIYVSLYSVAGLAGTTLYGHQKTVDLFEEVLSNNSVDEIKNTLYVPYPYDDIDYAKMGITVLDDDWAHYDRQSMPVFRTDNFSREQLWEMYVSTTRRITDAWREGLGFSSIDEVPDTGDYYSEYIQQNYQLKRSNKDE